MTRQIWWGVQSVVEIFDDDERDRAVRSGAALYLGKMREGMEKFDTGLLYFNKI